LLTKKSKSNDNDAAAYTVHELSQSKSADC